MTITIEVDVNKVLKDLSLDIVDEEGFIRELTLQGENYCKHEAPEDTGDMKRSISSRMEGADGLVTTRVDYAKHVIFGTSAHEIKVKKKKVLSDRNSGSPKKKDVIYGKRVMHPGTKPNNFPARALKRVQGEIPNIASKYVRPKS